MEKRITVKIMKERRNHAVRAVTFKSMNKIRYQFVRAFKIATVGSSWFSDILPARKVMAFHFRASDYIIFETITIYDTLVIFSTWVEQQNNQAYARLTLLDTQDISYDHRYSHEYAAQDLGVFFS